jgi:hypothetical protein
MASCDSCGMPYPFDGGDILIPTELWVRVSARGDERGLLCFNCIAKRATRFKIDRVPFSVASGPMVPADVRYAEGRGKLKENCCG